MAELEFEVTLYPDPVLRKVAEPVEAFDEDLRDTVDAMFARMRASNGVGLAAPQVAVPVRLVVVDTEWADEDTERNPLILVNPELVEPEGKVMWNEGCLSVPDTRVTQPQVNAARAASYSARSRPWG